MNYLLLESLKIYKLYYLYSILAVLLGAFLVNTFFELGFMFKVAVIIWIFLPEFIRLSEVQKAGYLKLVHKLPIHSNDLYIHKFFVLTSGTIWTALLIIAISNFITLPFKLYESFNLFVSYILIMTSLDKGFSGIGEPIKLNLQKFVILTISFFIYFSIFGLISREIDIDGHKSGNYLIIIMLQIAVAFYFGKLYNFLRVKYNWNQ